MSKLSAPPLVRVGIAGAGIIATIHLPNLRQLPGVEIRAICDVDAQRAQSMAQEYGAQSYTDVQQMLAEAQLDALFVCLPPFVRGDIIERAVERGLHVYVEKPLALDLATARRTAEVVADAGVITSVGYMWRYAAVAEQLRAVVGTQASALLFGRMLNGPPGPAWSFDRTLSGGLLVEFGTHMADLLRYLGGEVTAVSGFGTEVLPGPPTRGPDSAIVVLHYASGAVGSLQTSWAFPGAQWDLQAVLPDAQLELTLSPERLRGQHRGATIDSMSEPPAGAHPHGFGGPSWYLAVRAFIEAIQTNDPHLIRSPYADGVRTLALTLAADEAVRTGQTIAVPRS